MLYVGFNLSCSSGPEFSIFTYNDIESFSHALESTHGIYSRVEYLYTVVRVYSKIGKWNQKHTNNNIILEKHISIIKFTSFLLSIPISE